MRSLLWILPLAAFPLAAFPFADGGRLAAQEAAVAPPEPAAEPAAQTADEPAAQAADEPATVDSGASRFIRISETEQGFPKALETSIVRYKAGADSKYAGLVVDLVGVVHVGQKKYYRDLDKRLQGYDVVLYELVAPDGTRVAPEDVTASRSPLSAVQLGMRDMLNLEFQLQHINYQAKNFRHADMSPEEFLEDMEDRGDSLVKMGARMIGAGLASQAATTSNAGMLRALLSGEDRPKKMKQVMAQQLVDMEAMTAGLDDARGENTLIRGRNVKAFGVLREEIDSGKKRIAVFYGAGHLPDMAERLEEEFGLEPAGEEWLPAWDLQRN